MHNGKSSTFDPTSGFGEVGVVGGGCLTQTVLVHKEVSSTFDPTSGFGEVGVGLGCLVGRLTGFYSDAEVVSILTVVRPCARIQQVSGGDRKDHILTQFFPSSPPTASSTKQPSPQTPQAPGSTLETALAHLKPFKRASDFAKEVHFIFAKRETNRPGSPNTTKAQEQGLGLLSVHPRLNADLTELIIPSPAQMAGGALIGYTTFGVLHGACVQIGKDQGLLDAKGQPKTGTGTSTSFGAKSWDHEGQQLLKRLNLSAEIRELQLLGRQYLQDDSLPGIVNVKFRPEGTPILYGDIRLYVDEHDTPATEKLQQTSWAVDESAKVPTNVSEKCKHEESGQMRERSDKSDQYEFVRSPMGPFGFLWFLLQFLRGFAEDEVVQGKLKATDGFGGGS